MLKLRKQTHGFSLVELMVVVSIIGILGVIGFAGMDAYQRRLIRLEAVDLMQQISVAQVKFRQVNSKYASSLTELRTVATLNSNRFTVQVGNVSSGVFNFRDYDTVLTLNAGYQNFDPQCTRYQISVRDAMTFYYAGTASSFTGTAADLISTKICLGKST